MLLFSVTTFAQKKGKYVPSMPPPEILSPAKIYHFEGEENGLKVSLELQRKTAMSTKYAMKIEYADQRVIEKKGTVYMREMYDFGTEEREKDAEMYSCEPFTFKKENKGEYLEICISYNEDDKNDKKTVSFSYAKKAYPKIDMLNIDEK